MFIRIFKWFLSNNDILKNLIHFTICFVIFMLSENIAQAEMRTIELNMIGSTKYDNLYIRPWMLFDRECELIPGKTQDGQRWIFSIPDSVLLKSASLSLCSLNKTDLYRGTGQRRIGFEWVNHADTLIGHYFHFTDNKKKIQLNMYFSRTELEQNYQYIPSSDTTVLVNQWYSDYYITNPNQNQFLKENMITPIDFFFSSFGTDAYKDFLIKYAVKIQNNPNSLYYIEELASTLNYYESKTDIQYLYNFFSETVQNSYFGQIVNRHINLFSIDNVLLKNTDTEKYDLIVDNTDKYTLLVFSASYCVPCLKKIPMLKQIYEEQKDILDIVYISVDDENRLIQWKNIMQNENIQWKSLWLDKNNDFRSKWNINGIPDYLLIHPNLIAEKIQLKEETDVNNLYRIIRR